MRALAVFLLELARAARRERTYWLRTVYCATVSTAVALLWITHTQKGSWEQQQSIGREIFILFASVQFGLLNLAAPVSLCGAISEERNQRTLPVLLSTRLSNLQIIVGKLSGGMISVGLLLFAGLPVMFLLLVFGGISPDMVIAAFALTVTCAAVGGAAALFFSSLVRTNYTAFLLTVVFLWLYGFFFAPAAWLGLATKSGLSNSFQAFFIIVMKESQVVRQYEWLLVIAWSGLVVLFLVVFTAIPLRWSAARERGFGLRSFLGGIRGVSKRAVGGRHSGKVLDYPAGMNPIVRREVVSIGHAFWQGLRPVLWGGAVLLGVALFAYGQEMFPREKVDFNGHLNLLPKLVALLLFIPLVAGGRAFSAEKERDTFLVLLSTPISGKWIVLGKFSAVLIRLLPFLLIPLVYTVGFASYDVLPWRVVVVVMAECMAYGFFLLAVGVAAGLLVRKTARAVGLTAAVALLMNFILWGGQAIARLFYHGIDMLHAFSPWWILLAWKDILKPGAMDVELKIGLAANLGGHVLVGGCVLWLAVRYFDRLAGRVA